MTTGPRETMIAPPATPAVVRGLHVAILLALLAITAARATLLEAPYSGQPIADAGVLPGMPAGEQIIFPSQLLRVISAEVIFILAAVWALSLALWWRAEIVHPLLGVWIVLLAACLLASSSLAADRRAAVDSALEQISLVTAAFLMMQVCRPSWRRRLLIVVLGGMAMMLAAKGLYQVWVEIPAQAEQFEHTIARQMAEMGHQPGSPSARMLEHRLRETTAKGWFGLANVYGSLMVLLMLTAAGLAVDKWLSYWRLRREQSAQPKIQPHRKGDIPLPVLAGVLSSLVFVVAAVAWWMTESTGAILSGVLALVAAGVIYRVRDWAARRRRVLLIASGLILAAGLVAVVAVGIGRGSLPSRTLQVRWEYWTASAEIVRDNPVLGAGPGNFPDAYLPRRLPGAEEEVKNPHNVIVHALAEYGLAGGFVFLAILGVVLVALTRPDGQSPDDSVPPRDRRLVWSLLVVWAAMVAWRLAGIGYPHVPAVIYDNFIPALGLGAGLAIAMFTGLDRTHSVKEPGFGRIAVACGLGGFALHNLSDFALFMPGSAMAFWVAAGGLPAGKSATTWVVDRPAAVGVTAAMIAVVVAIGALVIVPVRAKTAALQQAAERLYAPRPDYVAASEFLHRAMAADSLDAAPAHELARIQLSLARQDASESASHLEQAAAAARTAFTRNSGRGSYLETYVQTLAYQLDRSLLLMGWMDAHADADQAARQMREALLRRPDDVMLLNLAAQYAYLQGELEQAENYLQQAIAVGDDWPVLWEHLGNVYHAQSREDEARQAWLNFLATRLEDLERWSELVNTAVESLTILDPQNARLHLRLAELAWYGGQPELAGRQLDAAEAAEASLYVHSVVRFTPSEAARISLLRAKVQAMSRSH